VLTIKFISDLPQSNLFRTRECLKQWAHEVDAMSLVVWKTLFVKLSAIEAEDKEA